MLLLLRDVKMMGFFLQSYRLLRDGKLLLRTTQNEEVQSYLAEAETMEGVHGVRHNTCPLPGFTLLSPVLLKWNPPPIFG
jgi:hypothetical protein